MKPTIKDVSRIANVSIATVSKVVNGKDENISSATRERIKRIIEEVGYVPNRIASSLVTKKTKTIGLIIPDIANPFFPELARGAEDFSNKEGYTIILCNSDNDLEKEDAYIDMLQEKMVDGIIFTASSNRSELSIALNKSSIPVITIERNIDGLQSQNTIVSNNENGAYYAVIHMIECGYEKILHISGPMVSKPAQERYKGYLRALKEKNIEPIENHLIEGKYSGDWGFETIQNLISQRFDYDGVFCGNDLIALGALKALQLNNINVPNQVGLVGYDDIYMAQMVRPELTTVKQPNYEMGYQAAEMLVLMINSEEPNLTSESLETRLIVRGTTRV